MDTPELDYITIRGFKSIASIEKLELRPINVVIGANGSGKSNFVEVFEFLHEIQEGRLDDYVRKATGAEQLLHFGSKVTGEIRIHSFFHRTSFEYDFTLRPTVDDGLSPSGTTLIHVKPTMITLSAHFGEPTEEMINPKPHARNTQNKIRTSAAKWRVYHLHDTSSTSLMRKTAKLDDNAFLRPDGSNLPAFLYLLQQKYPTQYDLIRRTVQIIAPFFDDFQLRPDLLNEEAIKLAWRHRNSDKYFNASNLSDGTLRFIALTTLFLQPDDFMPSVIIVDEPELGLHPTAITMLASMVKQASVKSQVILATQSTLLLDHFQPEDVLIADLVDGATQLTRLKPDRLAKWLEDYSLGQLWEKNEFGGRP
jgi:predicted ATPase